MRAKELIEALRDAMDSEYIQMNDDKIIELLSQAANKLEQFQQLVDGIMGDHYVDYLEFYFNRCCELEDELEASNNDSDDI